MLSFGYRRQSLIIKPRVLTLEDNALHIVEGALSIPVLGCGAIVSAIGVTIGLRKLDPEKIPHAGLLSAVFFVATLIHVPSGVSSVHLILNGLIGVMLGWAAFPVLLIALLLQAIFFGYGGLVVLGVNLMNVAVPAVLMFYMVQSLTPYANGTRGMYLAGIAGGGAVALSAIMVALSLAFSGEEFLLGAKISLIAHIPIMIVEGFITAFIVMFISKVKPSMLTFDLNKAV